MNLAISCKGFIFLERNDFINTKIKINLDGAQYKAKPNGGAVSQTLRTNGTQTTLPVADIAAALCRGQTITGGVLKGGSADDWTEQQLFIWDFDNGAKTLPHVTPEEINKILIDNGIYPVFGYWTFSHSPDHQKFRVVCVCSEVITDPQEATAIIKNVMSLFPTAQEAETRPNGEQYFKTVAQIDLSCTDLNRMFYGTDKGLIPLFAGDKMFDKQSALNIQPNPEHIHIKDEPEPEKVRTEWQNTRTNNYYSGYGNLDLKYEYSIFPLYEYIMTTQPIKSIRGTQRERKLSPCPICGHNDDFCVNTQTNLYYCHGGSGKVGGNIFNFIKTVNNWTDEETRDYFKYDLLKIDRDRENKEWQENQQKNKQKERTSHTPPPNDGQQQQKAPPLIWFDKIEQRDIDWYWYPYIRRGTINAIVATQGTGKSYLMCKVAAMTSKGERHKLPLQDKQYNYHPFTEPETTLYLNAEDDPEEDTRGRLELCGADLSKIATVELQEMTINFYNPCIEEWIKQAKPSLIVLDPVQQFFVGTDPYGKALDMNDSASVRPALTHLKMLAKKYNAAVVLIMHPNKNNMQSALYAAMGSNDFTAAPRSAVYIGRNPDDKEQRVIAITKANSVPDRHQKSIAYRFDTERGGIFFDGESPLLADDVRETKRSSRIQEETSEYKAAPKREEAEIWLENLLETAGGYMKYSDIEKAYKRDNISRATIHRALDKMKDFVKRTPKGANKIVYWYFDGNEPPEQITIKE